MTLDNRADVAAATPHLLKARDAWMNVMANCRDPRGLVSLPRPPMLEDWNLSACQLVSSRISLIERLPRGGRVAEVGVLAGDFSHILLDGCDPVELVLVDLDLRSHDIATRFGADVRSGRVILREGDSSQVLATFPDHHFDFIYIDADHTYDGVTKDIQVAKHKIRPDGLLVFNDYTFWSPMECLPYGVMRAVNELCLRERWGVDFFALEPYMYCDIAIRRL